MRSPRRSAPDVLLLCLEQLEPCRAPLVPCPDRVLRHGRRLLLAERPSPGRRAAGSDNRDGIPLEPEELALAAAGVPDEHPLVSTQHERTSLEQQRKRAIGSGHREPLLAHPDVAARPGTGKHPLRCTQVVLPDVPTRSGVARAVDLTRDQHDDLPSAPVRRNDQSQRLWRPSRSSANLTFPDEASPSSSGRTASPSAASARSRRTPRTRASPPDGPPSDTSGRPGPGRSAGSSSGSS